MSVKIVGLDESGQFENEKNEHFRFVGGYTLICGSLEKQEKLSEEKDKEKREKLRKEIREEDKQERDKLIIEVQRLLSLACEAFDRCAHLQADVRYKEQGSPHSIENKLLGILERTAKEQQKETISPIGAVYHVMYPLSLHGSEKVFFQRSGSTNNGTPRYLAYQSDDDGNNYNAWEKLFRGYIQDVVVMYLQERGAKLFCYLYPELKISNEDTQESNILNFAQGTNLYEYMSQAAVMNEIMYYPEPALTRYALELATRSVQTAEMDPEDARNLETKTGDNYLLVTSKNTYRTAVANMLNSSSWMDAYSESDYDIDVQSIKYHQGGGSYLQVPSSEKQTPLHYLSDIVCDLIKEQLKGKTKKVIDCQGSLKNTFIKLAENKDKIALEIRVLGKADLLYRRMIAALHEYKLADYYGYWYDLKNLKDKHGYSDFYIEYWVKKKLEPMREEYIHNGKTGNAIITELSAGYETVKNMMFNQQYDKMMYVALQIKKDLCDNKFFKFIRNKSYLDLLKFRFNGMILRGYNHHGNISEAQKIIDECENNATKVSPEEYLDFTVCTVEYYFNTFQYEEVIKRYERLALTKSNLWFKNYDGSKPLVEKSLLDQLCNCLDMVRRGASVQEEPQWIKLKDMHVAAAGRINSCLGQAYAFAQNWDTDGRLLKMKRVFGKAMDIFNEDDDNKGITLCHYLHALTSLENKKSFEENAASYFGVKSYDVETCWNALSGAIANSNYRFAIYLYMRAFRVFYATDENKGLFEEILNQILAVSDKIEKEHPWQLIYMNLYKIAKQYQMEDKLDALKEKVYSAVADPFFTIDMININFELQCMEDVESFSFGDKIGEWMEKNAKKNEDSSLYKLLKKYFQGDDTEDTSSQYIKKFFKIQADSTFQDLKNALEKVCTYEYC